MQDINPLLLTDAYKLGHRVQYPDKTEVVYSNWTPRKSRIPGISHIVNFGTQMVLQYVHNSFERNFFSRPRNEVCMEYQRIVQDFMNAPYPIEHIEALYDLGYLPIKVKALPEGALVPIRVPVLTIKNTKAKFFWITNYLETLLSCLLWGPMTSATIAHQYRVILSHWAEKTSSNPSFIDWQGHDFSMRGMYGDFAAILSACGHATSFTGSDTVPAVLALKKYYDAKGLILGSVNATEHSVMCAGGKEDEIETFRRLLGIYPTGILSVVSDTWDLWKVLTNYLPILKDEIMARDNGKLVIRPDSGDPVDIICGTLIQSNLSRRPTDKGVIELLWETFGGTVNDKGFKELDPHIGAIYGDSITLERAEEICKRLAAKGFASTNIVFGIGSYTYQYNTRDTFGFAMKATHVVIDGVGREIFKNPVTDSGEKKSACGLLRIDLGANGEYVLRDKVTPAEEEGGELKVIYEDGTFYNRQTLAQIRQKLMV